MKKGLLFCLSILFVIPFFTGGCQNSKTVNGDIFISDSVEKTAEWAGFDYNGVLARAKKGEYKAILEFLEFHGTCDGMDAINHAVTCLELIPIATDDRFSSVCQILKPKLRDIVRERLVQATGRTKNPALQNKSLTETCPMTWAALTGQANNNAMSTDPKFDRASEMPDNAPTGKKDIGFPAPTDATTPDAKTDNKTEATNKTESVKPATTPATAPSGGNNGATIKIGGRRSGN